MNKKVIIKSGYFEGNNGVIGSAKYFELETENYIIPQTVKIKINGKELYPTSFDEHGNPRLDGIASLIFIWNQRRMVMDGLIESEYSKLEAECEYDIATKYYEVSILDRIAKMNVCPMCGREFKINELKGELQSYEHILFHKKCLNEFYKMKMIDEIARKVQYGLSYKYDTPKWNKDITYELIENEYCGQECCSHRPWFLFNTRYGKIKLGWRKRVISITFFDGFDNVDFENIFKNENVTKGNHSEGYNIHAWGYEKLYEYLQMVANEINGK